MDGRRLEKQLKLSASLDSEIQNAVRDNLRAHYSKWTNYYLKTEQYQSAKESAYKAIQYKASAGIAVKCLLTSMFPRLTRKFVISREEREFKRAYGVNW